MQKIVAEIGFSTDGNWFPLSGFESEDNYETVSAKAKTGFLDPGNRFPAENAENMPVADVVQQPDNIESGENAGNRR